MIAIPHHFIVRTYTEALSRPPSPTELVYTHQSLQPLGCTGKSVSDYSASVLLSNEALSQPLTNRERVQTAYRVLLNRDPEKAGWDYFATLPFATTVGAIQRSAEYKNNILQLCTGTVTTSWLTPLDATVSDGTLRQRLAQALPGEVVTVSGRIAVTSPLVIPNGVTLQGKPGHYAASAHLLRSGAFTGPLVYVGTNASLRSLTVDGRRNDTGYHVNATNVEVIGSGASVDGVRSQNPAGWTALFVSPHYGSTSNITVINNLLIGYGTSRKTTYADGISIASDAAYVANNSVVDMTDVGIISFDPYNRGVNHTVFSNYVLNTVDTWAMMGLDQQQGYKSFINTLYAGNLVYTAGTAKARIGIINGASPWGDNRGPIVSPTYSGNYGYVRYEYAGVVSDGGAVAFPSISFAPVGAKVKPPCVGGQVVTSGAYNCLMSIH